MVNSFFYDFVQIPAVRQYIADMLENTDKKFLVFSHHLDMMKAVETEVIKKKVKYIRIAGDVAPALRGVRIVLLYYMLS